MKVYASVKKDSLGKEQYEFVEVENLELSDGSTVGKKFESIEALIEFVKEDQNSKIKGLEAQIKDLNNKLSKLLKATLEVK